MPSNSEIPVGTLFIETNALLKPSWMLESLIGKSNQILTLNRGFDGYITMNPNRDGDFSLLLGFQKPSPFKAIFIGIPGPNKTPIIHEIYVKE